jgi:hypothetical protein
MYYRLKSEAAKPRLFAAAAFFTRLSGGGETVIGLLKSE